MNGTKTPRDIVELEKLRCPELALSVYVPAERGVGPRYFLAQFKDLAHAELHKLDAREQKAFRREEPAVLDALAKRRFESPGLAVFSCTPRGLLQVWRLPEEVGGRMAVADWLDLAPIHRQLAEHPPALAAIVDKQAARLFALTLGEVTELEDLEGIPIAHHEQGGWSAPSYQRREEEHARKNLKQVASAVGRLLERGGYAKLLIAGPPESRALLKEVLDPVAAAALSAEGSIPIFAEPNELSHRLRSLLAEPAGASA